MNKPFLKDLTAPPRITFIGAGNMARSLLAGLVHGGYERERLLATDRNADIRAQISAQLGIATTDDNAQAAHWADIVVLAVKPQHLQAICREIGPAVQAHRPLILSIAAGIRIQDIDRWLGGGLPVVRTMPNTPALVQTGATGLYANAAVSQQQKDMAESIMRAVGITVWVEAEPLLDAVTALSGSGPAYFFMFMEAMEQAGTELGLSREQSHLLTLQTALGAAKMAMESGEACNTLRQRVTSPGGTTEQALKVFDKAQCADTVKQAMAAACLRAQVLADQLGQDQTEEHRA